MRSVVLADPITGPCFHTAVGSRSHGRKSGWANSAKVGRGSSTDHNLQCPTLMLLSRSLVLGTLTRSISVQQQSLVVVVKNPLSKPQTTALAGFANTCGESAQQTLTFMFTLVCTHMLQVRGSPWCACRPAAARGCRTQAAGRWLAWHGECRCPPRIPISQGNPARACTRHIRDCE